MTDDIAALQAEVMRLQGVVAVLWNCTDLKCSLCGPCLNALLGPRREAEIPEIAADDPIRIWRPGPTATRERLKKERSA